MTTLLETGYSFMECSSKHRRKLFKKSMNLWGTSTDGQKKHRNYILRYWASTQHVCVWYRHSLTHSHVLYLNKIGWTSYNIISLSLKCYIFVLEIISFVSKAFMVLRIVFMSDKCNPICKLLFTRFEIKQEYIDSVITTLTFYHWQALSYGPLTRYAKLRVAHAPGMSRTFSLPPISKESAS